MIERLGWFAQQRAGCTVFLFAFFVQLGAASFVGVTRGLDAFAFNSLDSKEYYQLAVNLVDHGEFSLSESAPLTPDTWRTPGYPLVLAVFMGVFGKSAVGLVMVNQVLSLVNALLFFRVAGTLLPKHRAMIASILFVLEPYHLLYSFWLLATTIFVTVLLCMWRCWQRYLSSNRIGWVVLVAALAGVAVLMRPVAILLPCALFLFIVIRSWRGWRDGESGAITIWRRLLAPVVFVAIVALPVGSWMMRNKVVAGSFSLSSQGGVVLAYFKATEVELWREGRTADRYLETTLDEGKRNDPHGIWESIDAKLRERLGADGPGVSDELGWARLAQGNQTRFDSFEISQALASIGLQTLLSSPASTLTCCVARCGSVLIFPLTLAVSPPAGLEVGRGRAAVMGSLYLLLFLGVLWRVVGGGWSFYDMYFPLMCTVSLLLATTPQIDPRFRVPMIPMLLVILFMDQKGRSPVGGSDIHEG